MAERRPPGARRWVLCALQLTWCVALGVPVGAQAGRAQVGASLGTWSNGALSQAQVSGSGWADGLLVQTVSDFGDALDDVARASLRVDGARVSDSARALLQGSAQLRAPDGAAGLPFAGRAEVASDLLAGSLRLRFVTEHVAYTVAGGGPGGQGREAYLSGHPFAELFEVFEVVYPLTRAELVQVALSLQLDGRVAGNSGDNGRIGGVQAYLQLAGVDTGESHAMLDPVWRSEAGVRGERLSFSGALQPGGCSLARGLCSGFVNLYAALDLRSRVLATGALDSGSAAPLDLDFSGQLALTVSPGVTLLRIGGSDAALPAVAWANVSAVPEPATWALWATALGLAGLAARLRRESRVRRCGLRAW